MTRAVENGPTLITGGAGFIGSALAVALLERGLAVRVLDNTPSDRLAPHPDLDCWWGDVTDAQTVARAIDGCSDVLHLAAITNVHLYMEQPETVLDTNILGTRNVLRACTEAGIPVLFTSSSETYGKNEHPLHPSGSTVLGPTSHRRWCYSVSKLAGEHYALAMRDRGLNVAIARYFNVYGPLMDAPGEGRVIGRFLGRIRDNTPLQLVDGGHAIRAFCHIDDAVRGTLALRDALLAREGVDGGVYNLGADQVISIRDLAAEMIALSGHTAGVESVDGKDYFGAGFEEIPRRVPDLDAMRALGFAARISLREGLKRTLDHWDLR